MPEVSTHQWFVRDFRTERIEYDQSWEFTINFRVEPRALRFARVVDDSSPLGEAVDLPRPRVETLRFRLSELAIQRAGCSFGATYAPRVYLQLLQELYEAKLSLAQVTAAEVEMARNCAVLPVARLAIEDQYAEWRQANGAVRTARDHLDRVWHAVRHEVHRREIDIRRWRELASDPGSIRDDFFISLYGRYGYLPGERWTKDAIAKGRQLLLDNLDPSQRVEYERNEYFHCVGGKTGTFYRITQGRQQNVFRCSDEGDVLQGLCFLPQGDLVVGDVMLAQKVALELDEDAALKVANPFGLYGGGQRSIDPERLAELRFAREKLGLKPKVKVKHKPKGDAVSIPNPIRTEVALRGAFEAARRLYSTND